MQDVSLHPWCIDGAFRLPLPGPRAPRGRNGSYRPAKFFLEGPAYSTSSWFQAEFSRTYTLPRQIPPLCLPRPGASPPPGVAPILPHVSPPPVSFSVKPCTASYQHLSKPNTSVKRHHGASHGVDSPVPTGSVGNGSIDIFASPPLTSLLMVHSRSTPFHAKILDMNLGPRTGSFPNEAAFGTMLAADSRPMNLHNFSCADPVTYGGTQFRRQPDGTDDRTRVYSAPGQKHSLSTVRPSASNFFGNYNHPSLSSPELSFQETNRNLPSARTYRDLKTLDRPCARTYRIQRTSNINQGSHTAPPTGRVSNGNIGAAVAMGGQISSNYYRENYNQGEPHPPGQYLDGYTPNQRSSFSGGHDVNRAQSSNFHGQMESSNGLRPSGETIAAHRRGDDGAAVPLLQSGGHRNSASNRFTCEPCDESSAHSRQSPYNSGQNLSSDGSTPALGKRKRSNFTKKTKEKLLRWLEQHVDNPYPSEADKQALALETSLTLSQVNNWFVNARRRNIWINARAKRAALASMQQSISPDLIHNNGADVPQRRTS